MPLQTFQSDTLEMLNEYINNAINTRACTAPRSITHYTTLDGLIGILKTGQLYAGNLIAMNDASEFVYARKELLRIITNSGHIRTDVKAGMIASYIKKRLEEKEPPRAFVTCFTSKFDATTHWQGYAGPSGFALHFDSNGIIEAAKRNNAYFSECIYRKNDQIDFINVTMTKVVQICQSIMNRHNINRDDDIYWIAEAGLYAMAKLSPMIKSDAFEHEGELRCFYYLPWNGEIPDNPDLSNVDFFNRGGILTARVCLNMKSDTGENGRLPLKGVTIGPSQYQGINEMTLSVILQKYGYKNIEIRKSPSPLRH